MLSQPWIENVCMAAVVGVDNFIMTSNESQSSLSEMGAPNLSITFSPQQRRSKRSKNSPNPEETPKSLESHSLTHHYTKHPSMQNTLEEHSCKKPRRSKYSKSPVCAEALRNEWKQEFKSSKTVYVCKQEHHHHKSSCPSCPPYIWISDGKHKIMLFLSLNEDHPKILSGNLVNIKNWSLSTTMYCAGKHYSHIETQTNRLSTDLCILVTSISVVAESFYSNTENSLPSINESSNLKQAIHTLVQQHPESDEPAHWVIMQALARLYRICHCYSGQSFSSHILTLPDYTGIMPSVCINLEKSESLQRVLGSVNVEELHREFIASPATTVPYETDSDATSILETQDWREKRVSFFSPQDEQVEGYQEAASHKTGSTSYEDNDKGIINSGSLYSAFAEVADSSVQVVYTQDNEHESVFIEETSEARQNIQRANDFSESIPDNELQTSASDESANDADVEDLTELDVQEDLVVDDDHKENKSGRYIDSGKSTRVDSASKQEMLQKGFSSRRKIMSLEEELLGNQPDINYKPFGTRQNPEPGMLNGLAVAARDHGEDSSSVSTTRGRGRRARRKQTKANSSVTQAAYYDDDRKMPAQPDPHSSSQSSGQGTHEATLSMSPDLLSKPSHANEVGMMPVQSLNETATGNSRPRPNIEDKNIKTNEEVTPESSRRPKGLSYYVWGPFEPQKTEVAAKPLQFRGLHYYVPPLTSQQQIVKALKKPKTPEKNS